VQEMEFEPIENHFLDFLITGFRKNRKNTKNTYHNGSFNASPRKPKHPIIPQYQWNFIFIIRIDSIVLKY